MIVWNPEFNKCGMTGLFIKLVISKLVIPYNKGNKKWKSNYFEWLYDYLFHILTVLNELRDLCCMFGVNMFWHVPCPTNYKNQVTIFALALRYNPWVLQSDLSPRFLLNLLDCRLTCYSLATAWKFLEIFFCYRLLPIAEKLYSSFCVVLSQVLSVSGFDAGPVKRITEKCVRLLASK